METVALNFEKAEKEIENFTKTLPLTTDFT